MNWFTRGFIMGSPEHRQKLLDEDGGCEHAEKDINLAAVIRREMDSFGPVSSYVCCKACDEKAEEERDNEVCVCKDCSLSKKRKDGAEWRWYDFYAPQGDVAPWICNDCRMLPKHLDRVARDDADRRAEFGDEPDQDDSDWDGPDHDDEPMCQWTCPCCHRDIEPEDDGRSHDDYPSNICTPCFNKRA